MTPHPPDDPAAGMHPALPILLVRHPPVQVAPGTCYGRLDLPPRPGWEARADGLAVLARGAGLRVLYTAPAVRCHLPARRVAERAGLALHVDPRLAELDFGTWEGLAWARIDRAALDAWAADPEGFAPPGGESGHALRRRVGAFWTDMLHAGRPAGVMTHGGPLRLLGGLAAGRTPRLLDPPPPQGAARLFSVVPAEYGPGTEHGGRRLSA
ncbi:histidine phosphatase family protein [Nguyenibacter sp. L1]|uniref:histidine phosphatase family protein n=1 Tax=Nguyenibacter sp. L1 TaxID=3049350 RepID=UPI002B484DFB|nr:histidine phosphatase family protein [Nguyenibacter sp. L1]WRH87268.1 histidine phosphatase family protein [Nguyenibacter sp. L1]